MSDLSQGPGLVFDLILLIVIIVSMVMSLGRGLIREASSVLSFIVGGIVGFVFVRLLGGFVEPLFPDSWSDLVPATVVFLIGFLVAYSLAAFIGGRLSRLVHASPEIGLLDRLAGAAFGIARGILAGVLFVLLVQQVLPEESVPEQMTDAFSYQYLDGAASWIRNTIPGFVEKAGEAIADPVDSIAGSDE